MLTGKLAFDTNDIKLTKLNDKVISSVEDVEVGDEVDIEFDDGIINTKVI